MIPFLPSRLRFEMSQDEEFPVFVAVHEGPAAEVFNEVVGVPFLLRKTLWDSFVLSFTSGSITRKGTHGDKGMMLTLIICQAIKGVRRPTAFVEIVMRLRVLWDVVVDPAIDLIHSDRQTKRCFCQLKPSSNDYAYLYLASMAEIKSRGL